MFKGFLLQPTGREVRNERPVRKAGQNFLNREFFKFTLR